MKDLFQKDITIKIISVVVAIVLWLIVYNNSNPYVTQTFSNIPLKVLNENYLDDNGYRIKNKYRTTIDVTVRGRQEAVSKVRTSDFEASIDFSRIKSVNDKTLEIIGPYCSQKDVTIVSCNPASIDIQLARNKSGTFPVELKSNISMKPGYVLLNTTLTPDSFPILAEESIIDSVDKIVANLDVKNLDRDTEKTVMCKVYNKDGKEIISLNTDLKVSVKLDVAKEVPISLATRGRPAEDYVETLREISPTNALITGPGDVLAKIADIKTEQLDIGGISRDIATTVPIAVPEGIKLVNTPKDISVKLNFEKLKVRDIELTRNDILLLNANNDGMLSYEIKTDKLTVQIKGRQADINALTPESLRPTLDVSGLTEGTYNLPLNISLPPQVKLQNQANVEVKIEKAAEPLAPQTP